MYPPIIDKLLSKVIIEENLLPYLRYSGWEQETDKFNRWIVMHGGKDYYGNPFELVFPIGKTNNEVLKPYIVKAIELLSTINNEQMQLLLQNIVYYDRDLLYVRNLETDEEESIVLNLAVNQITNIKNTLEYSACAEKEARPYYYSVSAIARKHVNNFLFGHTFSGSFGFTVETPKLSDPSGFVQSTLNFPEENLPIKNIPFERRIMERIARGLNFTKEAEKAKDHRILLAEYSSGFNSNMCSSIIGISKERKSTVEFRIVWSPKVKIGEDIEKLQPVRIHESGYEILEYVAKELKKRIPEYLKLTGRIKGLTATDNPLSLGTRRAIVIKAILPERKHATDVILELERDDYVKAIKAHMEWQSIQVDGILSRSGSGWRLLDIRNFQVLG